MGSTSFGPFYLQGSVKDWSDETARIAGRKRYPPRHANAPDEAPDEALRQIRNHLKSQLKRLTVKALDNAETKNRLSLLKAKNGGVLNFSSRIRLHNVRAEEIGLVLWALTHGGDDGRTYRHMIGRAKPYGAGQLRLARATLSLQANGREGAKLLAPDAAGDSMRFEFVKTETWRRRSGG